MSNKQTIVGRFYRDVAKPIVDAADGLSWSLFAVALMLTAVSFLLKFHIFEVHGAVDFFDKHYWQFVYLAWALFVISTIGPLLHIASQNAELPLGVLASIAVIHVLTFLIISGVVLAFESGNGVAAITTLLGAAAAGAMAGIGWVIQYQSSSRSSRRSHTFTILMQSRLSKEFQEHVKNRGLKYPCPTVIPEPEILKYYKLTQQNDELAKFEKNARERINSKEGGAKEAEKEAVELERAELQTILNAMQAVKYLLNFYEFLSAGIKKRELDEELLYETLSSIAVGLYNDTANVRKLAKEAQPMAYEHFEELLTAKWLARERAGNARARLTT